MHVKNAGIADGVYKVLSVVPCEIKNIEIRLPWNSRCVLHIATFYFQISTETVEWDPSKLVYAHESKDM